MIESSVILFVFLTAVALFVGARLLSQHNRRKNPAAEIARLNTSLAWHEERLMRARQKGWDHDMVSQISTQIAETRAQLVALQAEQKS